MKFHIHITLIIASIYTTSAFGMEITSKTNDMESKLYIAAGLGNLDKVKKLIEKGCPIDCTLNNKTPLFEAISQQRLNTAKYLIQQGANVNQVCLYQETPFMISCDCGYELVQIALDHGGNIHAKNVDKNTMLHFAADYNIPELAAIALSQGINVNVKNKQTERALHIAAENKSKQVFLILLAAQANTNLLNNKGQAPIHIIASKGHIDLLELLHYTQRTDFNKKTTPHSNKFPPKALWYSTPLHLAAYYGRLEIIKKLLFYDVAIDQTGKHDRTALHYAAAAKGCFCVLSSLQAGDSHVATVQYLLEKGLDPNIQDNKGNTALHTAIKKNHTAIIPLLIQHGALTDIKNQKGKTALDLAQENNIDLNT